MNDRFWHCELSFVAIIFIKSNFLKSGKKIWFALFFLIGKPTLYSLSSFHFYLGIISCPNISLVIFPIF